MQSQKQLLELKGSVEEIIYRNENNGYTVIEIAQKGCSAVAVGLMADINCGDLVNLKGDWKTHKDYGVQFAFESYEIKPPETSDAILRYLSSGIIKGIGRATAKNIVKTFGKDTFDVMQNEPERLEQIKGISHEKALQICAEVKKIFGMREVMVYLQKFGISPAEGIKIWKNFGDSSIDIIKKNPYILCKEEIGISFERADKIAYSLNIPNDSPERIYAGIMYIIYRNSLNGHSCLPRTGIIAIAQNVLGVDSETVTEVLNEMIIGENLTKEKINERIFIFTPEFHTSEIYSAKKLKMMAEFPPQKIKGAKIELEEFQKENGIKYAPLQKKAILKALSDGILVLTGRPGTGKTTTLNGIIRLYEHYGLKVLLAAPTGRAAKRMSEVTGRNASTIHRLLGVEWDDSTKLKFVHNENNHLKCDAVIIDEMSMVDITVFEAVLRALPENCRLVMVGDSDQLPSVGAGNVLGDIIKSEKIPVVQLEKIFRQSEKSLIIKNAHKIVHGEMPDITHTDNDFFFMHRDSAEEISDTIIELYTKRLPKTYKYISTEDIQILCPSRKGELGVTELNKKLQSIVNPPKGKQNEISTPSYIFRTGDKVMQTKNNYNAVWTKDDGTAGTGIFNGDIGIITSINKPADMISVKFDDRTVLYTSDTLVNLELAYASTVHKSQGNEFTAVIIPLYKVPSKLCYRNLIYTAVTRAKKMLILVGSVADLERMVENKMQFARYTGLKAFLEE